MNRSGSFRYTVNEGDYQNSKDQIDNSLGGVLSLSVNFAFAKIMLWIICKPTILVKGCVRGRWSWGVSLHHPFEAGLLSSCVLHPSHHRTELQSWQVTTRGKSWQSGKKTQTFMSTLQSTDVQYNTDFGWAGKYISSLSLCSVSLGLHQVLKTRSRLKWRTVVLATMITKVIEMGI